MKSRRPVVPVKLFTKVSTLQGKTVSSPPREKVPMPPAPRGHWSFGDRVLGCKGVPGSAVHRHLVHLPKQVEDRTVPYPGSRGWGTPALHGNTLCISSAQAWPRSRSGSSYSCAWEEEVVCNTKKEKKQWAAQRRQPGKGITKE